MKNKTSQNRKILNYYNYYKYYTFAELRDAQLS